MAVDNLSNFLLRESGRFAQDILQRTLHTDPMLDLMRQGSWPEGMGYSVNITQYERSLPASTYSDGGAITNPAYNSSYWTDVGTGGFGSTAANNCTPPEIELAMGTSKTLFNLQHVALNSQRFCATDLLTAFEGPRQLAAIKENLATNTQFLLAEKFRRDYTYWCANKVVVTSGGIVTSTSASGTSASFNDGGALQNAGTLGGGTPASLTMEHLLEWYDRLNLNGASRGALTMEDGAAVHGLILSHQLARNLMISTEYRQDFRWNPARVPELLKALNVSTPPVLGYQFLKTSVTPRWNYTAGAWVKVEPYYIVAANNGGYKVEENPSYRTAQWEDTLVFHPEVAKIVFPGSVSNTSGTNFQPVNYRGAWKWVNIPSEANKDGDIGFFRGRFMLGAMPEYTNFGVVIRHCRSNMTPQYAACA